ncbi:MAG: hypothetical protein WAZ27_00310 [Minisyncoccia bacterium]
MPFTIARSLAPYVLLAAFTLVLFFPLLFGGKASSGEEQIGFYYPMTKFTQAALQNDTSFVWNGHSYGGVPVTLDQFASAWNPLNRFLLSFLDFFDAQHFAIYIATTLGLFFAFWFGTLQGWRRASSLSLALGYLSATTFGWIQTGTLPSVAFIICPALLIALVYASRAGTASMYAATIFFGGALLGFGLVAGFMQFILYNCCVAGLFALFLDWHKVKPHIPLWKSFSTSLAYVGMSAVALIIGIKQWLPSAMLLDLSVRTDTFAIQHATSLNVIEFMAWVLPPLFEIPLIGGGRAEGFYIGALGIVCACIGLRYYRTPTSIFFATAYVIVSAFAFHVPVFSWLNEHVSPFSHMSGNLRWLSAGAFPLAYLGATGIEGLLRNPGVISRTSRRIILLVVSGIAVVFVLGSLVLSYGLMRASESPEMIRSAIAWFTGGRELTQPYGYYETLFIRLLGEVSGSFSLSNPRYFFSVFVWMCAACVVALLFSSRRRYGGYAVVAVTVLTVGGTMMFQWNSFVPQELYRTEPALVSYLNSREFEPHSYRILGVFVGDGLYKKYFSIRHPTVEESMIQHRETLSIGTNVLYDIDSMSGLRPYQSMRMNQLLSTVVGYDSDSWVLDERSFASASNGMNRMYNREVQKSVDLPTKMQDFTKRLPLVSMMNIKYVYSPYELSDPPLRLATTITMPISGGVPLYVYENMQVLPRVYFAESMRFVSGSDLSVLKEVSSISDFSKESVIECTWCENGESSSGSVTVARYENGDLAFDTESETGGWMIVSESFAPGWSGTMDGASTTVFRANYLFQAIEVPAGRHHIRLFYRDPSLLDYSNKYLKIPI